MVRLLDTQVMLIVSMIAPVVAIAIALQKQIGRGILLGTVKC
jgi:ABC-type glycerol-3-phosphate transport system permease component